MIRKRREMTRKWSEMVGKRSRKVRGPENIVTCMYQSIGKETSREMQS
jgi:hypothetical protein